MAIEYGGTSLSRGQLALFLPNQESIKEFERLFAQDIEEGVLITNIINSVGLNIGDASYVQRGGSNYLNASTTIYQDSTILDGVTKAITVGTGLNQDGSYIQNLTTNYISTATSLDNADELLDNAIYTHTREFVLKSTISLTLSAISQTVLIDATSGAVNVTLPSPSACFDANRSRKIAVYKTDITINQVNILPNGGELVAGGISQFLKWDNEVLNFITDGTNWYLGS